MFTIYRNILIIIAIIHKSLSIGVEYYMDLDDDISATTYAIKNESVVRRTLENHQLLQTNESVSNILVDTNKNNVKGDNVNGSIILSYNSPTHKQPLQMPFIAQNIPITLQNITNNNFSVPNSLQSAPQTMLSLKLNLFEEYDYKYENETDDELQALRLHVQNEILLESQNKSEPDTPYAKFYNLEPAVEQELSFNKTKYILDRTWYVPQDFPCWDLPVLYGKLGIKKKKSNVFLIYDGNLVNVIDPSTETHSNYKSVEPAISYNVNKWCEVEPCYGDHTLCLFSATVVSNICDKNYKIIVPTIRDQFALVNTINTMRNHVANGMSLKYSDLPTAANMKQITYDYDLEEMAAAWLHQCLPGSAPCSSLDGNLVSHLECTKYAKYCCSKTSKFFSKCTPLPECYVYPIIGCIHVWFSSAGKNLIETDIRCGRTSLSTFNTVQLLWAKTNKIGCAYGERSNGDIRVVCNFSPGAPFFLDTKLYCGIIDHKDIEYMRNNENLTDLLHLASLGIKWRSIFNLGQNDGNIPQHNAVRTLSKNFSSTTSGKFLWGVDSLTKLYSEGWVRKETNDHTNGTRSMTARLVAKYTFIDESESRCDSDESIYIAGSPGSLCVEKGRTYHGLCYEFRDPTPGYRLIAIAAPIALFSLILYDLFSGVVRQTNN